MSTDTFNAQVTADIQRIILREAKERYEAGVALPQGWPTMQEQREYWERKDAQAHQCERCDENGVEAYEESDGFTSYRPCNGANDWLDEEQQYSNYEGHEL